MPHIFAQIIHHPVSYGFGPLQFTGFGFAMLMCFVIGQIILQRELVRKGEDPTPAGDMIFAAVIGGLLGAKIYYAILMGDAGSLLSRAGFVFWGGLIGGIIAVTAVVMWKKTQRRENERFSRRRTASCICCRPNRMLGGG